MCASSPAATPTRDRMTHVSLTRSAPRSRRSRPRATRRSNAARARSTAASCSACPASDPAPSNDQGLLVHDMLWRVHEHRLLPRRRPRRATCWSGTAPTATRCASSSRGTPPVPVGGRRRRSRTSTSSRASTGSRAPMFMATARIDAIWVHDGLLDARDYKTGRCWHTRVCDVPAAKVQAFVLGRAANRHAGCELRLRYEYLQPEDRRGSRTMGTRRRGPRAVEEELRGRSSACGRSTTGPASPTRTSAVVPVPVDLPRQRRAAASPRGRCSRPQKTEQTGTGDRADRAGSLPPPWILVPRSSSASARRRSE